MSFAVHFLPAGTSTLPDDPGQGDQDQDPDELAAEEVGLWDRVQPALLEVLPADEYVLDATPFARQVAHRPSGLLVSWQHDDYQASLPFWSTNADSGAFDTLVRVTLSIEETTGLVGLDEITGGRFLDHHAELASSFAAVAEGFEEAMEQQTLLGRLRSMFHRG
ncbi:hypothetical protein [Micropruina sonneratiae]|uniref:hypothetical protein n=1 Tax=Micropruina sonneratiae TaxID=2986940 RepID=UPI002225D6A4|nr:hypothetical protein [Micropruina sp. KQZ13P-5]MCW3158489.1 hypothetical protein [Micropruina sp. KQZ13P-5]